MLDARYRANLVAICVTGFATQSSNLCDRICSISRSRPPKPRTGTDPRGTIGASPVAPTRGKFARPEKMRCRAFCEHFCEVTFPSSHYSHVVTFPSSHYSQNNANYRSRVNFLVRIILKNANYRVGARHRDIEQICEIEQISSKFARSRSLVRIILRIMRTTDVA